MTDRPAKAPVRRAGLVLAIAAAVLLVLALALYASRRVIAREALTGWLEARGIASSVEVETFGLRGFTGKLRVGDPNSPDFTAERAEVEYGLKGFAVEVRSVKLVKPVLRANFKEGKLSAGSLDPLIAEFRKRPPRPDARKPRIEVDDGLLLLATDYGPVRLTADAVVNDGLLTSLVATSAAGRFKGEGFDLGLGASTLRANSRANRLDVFLDAPIADARAGLAAVRAGRLQLTLAGPYPDLQKKRGEGELTIRANLRAQELKVGEQGLGAAELSADFAGRTAGWVDTLAVAGDATADLRAASGGLGPARAQGLRATASATNLRWTRKGGDAVSARLQITGLADRVVAQQLSLQTVRADLHGPLAADGDGASLSLSGAASGRGGWTGLGLPNATDSANIAAVKRGARSFAFQAPGLAISIDRGPMRLALLQPVSLLPDAGGQVRLTPRDEGYQLTLTGGRLPLVDAHISRFALQDGGATVGGRAKAKLSIGPIEDGVFDASGTVRIADGVRFTGDRCASVTARKLELGVNDVERFSGRLCPDGRPMLTLVGGGWSLAGRAQAVGAEVPFLQARISDARGSVTLGQTRDRLYATAAVADARVSDTAAKMRFHPLRMSGRAVLARFLWSADLAFETMGGTSLGKARLLHDGATGAGGVDIDSGLLTFAENGLQPKQLSPLAEMVGSPAEGSARFTGGFRWTIAGVTSSGALSVPDLDFESPAGRVTGLSGDIAFTSLAPLIAAPGQQLRAENIAALAPLTGVNATFALEEKALRISGGEAAVGGGRVLVESLDVPLDPGQPTRGVLVFEGVQLHDLVEASPFGEWVDLDAKVSGRVPFEAQGQRVRIPSGSLRAIQPGRLSIQRTIVSGVKAEAEVTAPPGAADPGATTDTFTDFAYQAMENLAFDTLDATIETRADERLRVLFHIIGKHDPPQKQEIRLTWMDLLRRNFMNRKLPLPSGTGVNLTLDTTLNLDELLRDYAEYQKLRSSPPVQP